VSSLITGVQPPYLLRMVDWFYFLEFVAAGKVLYTQKECSQMLHNVYTINTDFHVSLITAAGLGILINDFILMVILITIHEGPH